MLPTVQSAASLIANCLQLQEVKKTTSQSQWGFTETKSNQADMEKFTVCVMGSNKIKEKSCRFDALHMRYRSREFESVY